MVFEMVPSLIIKILREDVWQNTFFFFLNLIPYVSLFNYLSI